MKELLSGAVNKFVVAGAYTLYGITLYLDFFTMGRSRGVLDKMIRRRQSIVRRIPYEKTNVTDEQKNAGHFLNFVETNQTVRSRINTLYTKEPETIQWLEEHCDAVLFDIGANIGLYSVYFAKKNNKPVFAFEPSVFNLPTLIQNININGLQDHINVIPNPLIDNQGLSKMYLVSDKPGDSGSQFRETTGPDGCGLTRNALSYHTVGFSLDWLIEKKLINIYEFPKCVIKIDVDGLEHHILRGCSSLLLDSRCVSVLVETLNGYLEQENEVKKIMHGAGFVLGRYGSSGADGLAQNQIFYKQ